MQHSQAIDQTTAEMLDVAPWIKIVLRQIRAKEMAENLTAAMGGNDESPPAPAKTLPTL